MLHKAWSSIEEVPYCFWRSSIKFQGHMGWKINDLNPIWVRLLGRLQLSNPSDLPCFSIFTHRSLFSLAVILSVLTLQLETLSLAINSLASRRSGPWFNIKMSSYQYRKSHYGDKMVVRSSYIHNGISYTGKMSSLYWIRALGMVL